MMLVRALLCCATLVFGLLAGLGPVSAEPCEGTECLRAGKPLDLLRYLTQRPAAAPQPAAAPAPVRQAAKAAPTTTGQAAPAQPRAQKRSTRRARTRHHKAPAEAPAPAVAATPEAAPAAEPVKSAEAAAPAPAPANPNALSGSAGDLTESALLAYATGHPALSAPATTTGSGVQIVAADELNDIDRAADGQSGAQAGTQLALAQAGSEPAEAAAAPTPAPAEGTAETAPESSTTSSWTNWLWSSLTERWSALVSALWSHNG